MNMRKSTVLGALLLFGAAGCADLDVTNPNDPDRELALASASDVEALISGGFSTWFFTTYDNDLLALSTMSFQTSAPWNNFGMVPLSALPRNNLVNDPADQYYNLISLPWTNNYRALAAVADGLRSIDDASTGVAEDLGAERTLRARAFGRFVQGLAHANLAVLYDQGFVIDETTELTDAAGNPIPQEAVPYTSLMNAAIDYFAEAISLSQSDAFTVPADWMSVEVSSGQLARIAHSMRAAYRASLPRTPEERSVVDWEAVLADIDAGVTEDWIMDQAYPQWWNSFTGYAAYPRWHQLAYPILGMADQSGNFQTWLATPIPDRHPILGGENMLIVTPDERYPQGSTVDEQKENPGSRWGIPRWLASQWSQPARGTWRWSWYYNFEYFDYAVGSDETKPAVAMEEMTLLAAEANYWLGDRATAADLVNVSRVGVGGLNPTDAVGTNTSCVPRLPSGQCGDLLEMIKWEKRNETWLDGIVMNNSWYFDARRWGDHYKGTALQFPIPARELQVLEMLPVYSFGGAEQFSAPGSTYAWPGEQ